MKKLLLLIFVVFGLSACFQSPYEGFSYGGDFYYKRITFGDGETYPRKDEYIVSYFQFKDKNGNLIDNNKLRIRQGSYMNHFDKLKNETLQDALKLMSGGDSVHFIFNAQDILRPHIKDIDTVFAEVKMFAVYSNEEYQKVLADFEKWNQSEDKYEKKLLKKYLVKNKIKIKPEEEGLYIIPIKEGKGKTPQMGDVAYIHYKGYFLDGTEFDNTYNREPLEYRIGEKDQVIRGFEIAIPKLNKGAKAKLIIPSYLAFGKNGSSSGIVPPNTTLIYEVELIKIL
ncbi:MAG: FKBP-type peptidyl-prolyl cis-trans isomerase [Bacteroidia bacterium]